MCVCVCFHELLSLASFFFSRYSFLKGPTDVVLCTKTSFFYLCRGASLLFFFFSRIQTLHYETVRRIKRGKKKDNDITGVVKAVSVGWA